MYIYLLGIIQEYLVIINAYNGNILPSYIGENIGIYYNETLCQAMVDDFIDRNIKQEGVSIDDLEVPPFLRKHPGALRRLRSGTL